MFCQTGADKKSLMAGSLITSREKPDFWQEGRFVDLRSLKESFTAAWILRTRNDE
jgi:hypothetical protein